MVGFTRPTGAFPAANKPALMRASMPLQKVHWPTSTHEVERPQSRPPVLAGKRDVGVAPATREAARRLLLRTVHLGEVRGDGVGLPVGWAWVPEKPPPDVTTPPVHRRGGARSRSGLLPYPTSRTHWWHPQLIHWVRRQGTRRVAHSVPRPFAPSSPLRPLWSRPSGPTRCFDVKRRHDGRFLALDAPQRSRRRRSVPRGPAHAWRRPGTGPWRRRPASRRNMSWVHTDLQWLHVQVPLNAAEIRATQAMASS